MQTVLKRPYWILGLALVACLPLAVRGFMPESEKYYLHILVQILLWSFIYTSWSLMGRFGMISLGHGAFTGIGAYVTVLLWNYAGISPWIGIPVAVVSGMVAGLILGYPSFRLRISGHYFALLTLAFTEFVRLCIVGLREYTGGSLGTQPERLGSDISFFAFQFESNRMLAFYIAFGLWLLGLYVWHRVDISMHRYALDAINEDEEAASSVGIDVLRERLKITALSCGMSALGGAIFAQYQMYISPETIAGLGLSLNIVFAVIVGGLSVILGPTIGAVFTQLLSEVLRVAIQGSDFLRDIFGSSGLALDQAIFGLLLIFFIIYMPQGIVGRLLIGWRVKRK